MNLLEKIPENSDMLEKTGSPVEAQKMRARGLAVKSDQIVLSSAFACEEINESAPVTDYRELLDEPAKIAQLYDWSLQYATDDKIRKFNASKAKASVDKIKRSY
jgi:hypothetical protein